MSYTINKAEQIGRINNIELGRATGDTGAPPAPGEAQNFLLVGIDRSDGLDPNDPVARGRQGEQNSDTIIILRIDPARHAVSMLSLPRDLWVHLGGPDGPQGKINSAIFMGGPDFLVKTIRESLKIGIDHYVEIDLNGFRQLIAAIGGVPMQFTYPSRDQSTGLYQPLAGCVTLDADQSLAFARSRKMEVIKRGYWESDGGDDLARAKRQQELIRAALKQAFHKGARNPVVLNGMIEVVLRNVHVDEVLSVGDLVDLAANFRDLDPAAIASYSPSVTEEMISGAAAVRLNERDSQPIFEIFRGHDPLVDVRPFVRVEVRSSTGEKNKASLVGFELATHSFSVTATRDDPGYRGMPTRIVYADDREKISAVILARYLDLNVPIERGSVWMGDSRIALIVGSDYAGLRGDTPRPLEDFRAHLPPEMFPAPPADPNAPTTTATLPFAITTSSVAGIIPDAPEGCGD